MEKNEAHCSFPDHHQNFWHLACIQSASLGIPGILIGGYLARRYGTGAAITSVIIGNLILWMVGLGIISMTGTGRDNALQNVKHYLGKVGSISAALFLILAFISWYILQLNTANAALSHILMHRDPTLRFGAGLGALIALISIGGIQTIKKYCVIVFPFLLIFVICSIGFYAPKFHLNSKWDFSFLGIISVISITLPGIVNLPTFFRHSRSHYDSYLGLSLMIFFTIIFQIYPIVVGFYDIESIVAPNYFLALVLSLFIFLSLVAVNLVNIYFASAGWEMIFPHHKSNKEFVIVGLLGTLAYTFLQISSPMQFLLDMAENFIASLGIILLIAFLVKTFAQHRPRPMEKFLNLTCWFFGGIVGTIFSSMTDVDSSRTLVISISASCILFACIIYVEETYWSAKKILTRTHHDS